jgi:site-specific DNA-methyltransferase (adenine-specific)
MQHLIRHITPPGGTVLDPFAGSGTTGEAAKREGFDCVLMEQEPEYIAFLADRFSDDA